MKILIVQDHLRSGGTERQAVLLANAFAASGHATTLLTFRPRGALDPTVATNVARKTLQPFDSGLDWFAPGLRSFVRQTSPDIVLCLGRIANSYASSLPARTVIATMRTGKALPFLFRRSLQRVRHIVANSHAARDTLIHTHTIAAEKITVIHNALVFPATASSADSAITAPASSSSPRAALRAQHAATDATLILLNVAMFRPEKNHRELIELAAGLPHDLDWQLWQVGDGPTRAACEQLAAASNLAHRIKFFGFRSDPSPLYAAADVAVHASARESLSNFFIEAQAHGLPCVAYDAQGLAETFVPNRTGWIIPRDDRAAFRKTLENLAREPAPARAARAAAARTFARNTFDPARQTAAYLDLFARLLAPSVSSPPASLSPLAP